MSSGSEDAAASGEVKSSGLPRSDSVDSDEESKEEKKERTNSQKNTTSMRSNDSAAAAEAPARPTEASAPGAPIAGVQHMSGGKSVVFSIGPSKAAGGGASPLATAAPVTGEVLAGSGAVPVSGSASGNSAVGLANANGDFGHDGGGGPGVVDDDDNSGADTGQPAPRPPALGEHRPGWRSWGTQGRPVHWAGRIVIALGPISLLLFLLFPLAMVIIVFGVIPVGNPFAKFDMSEQAAFMFVILPSVFTVLAYLSASVFFGVLDIARPFRHAAWTVMFVWLAEMAVFVPLIYCFGVFPLLGVAAIVLCYFVIFVALYVQQVIIVKPDSCSRQNFHEKFLAFLRIFLTVQIWLGVLVGYVFAYRYSGSTGQNILPPFRGFFLFVMRLILLSFTDRFPLDMAMMVSCFWVTNLDNVFQTLAFPATKEPGTFAIVWFSNAAGNLTNIVFLTSWWFEARVWIKHNLKHVFTCNFPIPPRPQRVLLEDPDDRGHSMNMPGYRRRQLRWFMWRILSQVMAMCFYLALTPVLRYGLNSKYSVFSELSQHRYAISLAFTASNLGFVLLTGFAGWIWARWQYPRVYDQVKKETKRLMVNLNFIGFVIAMFASNCLLGVSFLFVHFQIWYAWSTIGHTITT